MNSCVLLVTSTTYAPMARGGAVQMTSEYEIQNARVAVSSPKRHVLPGSRFLPMTLTLVPPWIGPERGKRLSMWTSSW